jgi:glucose/galactose transporter
MSLHADRNNKVVSVLIIGTLFFVFGFVTWLNGSLIPFLHLICELSHLQAYFVTLAFYISYTFMALPASLVLQRTGYKHGIVAGLLVMAIGALIFIPAAATRLYSVFLIGLFVMGAGLTLLQTAANPYIVLIGPSDTAAVRISIMGLLNKSAGIVAPVIFTALVLGNLEGFAGEALSTMQPSERDTLLNELASELAQPYLILAGMLAALAAFIKYSPLSDPILSNNASSKRNFSRVFRHPNLVLGAIALFFYMGAEVIAGDTIGLFGRELGVANFAQLTAYTMAFMLCGYLLGILLIPRLISQEQALSISATLGLVLSIAVLYSDLTSHAMWTTALHWTGVPAIPNAVLIVAILGLANALVWPAIWPLALRGVKESDIGTGSALLIMAIAGGAILPVVFGAIADASEDPRNPYWIMIPCYLFVLYYALVGHRLDAWRRPNLG